MEYSELIDKIMSYAETELPVQFIISKDGGKWALDFDITEQISERIIDIIERKTGVAVKAEHSCSAGVGKRVINGYAELNSILLAGNGVIIAERIDSAEPYLVCDVKRDNLLNSEEYSNEFETPDYLEALQEYIKRESKLSNMFRAERYHSGLPYQTLNSEYCIPGGIAADLTGTVIIIKPEALPPELRSAEYQLKYCVDGAETVANLLCLDLYSGIETRYERVNVLGAADTGLIPEWSRNKLAAIKSNGKTAATEPDSPNNESINTAFCAVWNVIIDRERETAECRLWDCDATLGRLVLTRTFNSISHRIIENKLRELAPVGTPVIYIDTEPQQRSEDKKRSMLENMTAKKVIVENDKKAKNGKTAQRNRVGAGQKDKTADKNTVETEARL
jgi:hypothetical protein